MKDFKKYTDEDLSFFFSRGLSIHRRYRGEVKDVFKDIAIKIIRSGAVGIGS